MVGDLRAWGRLSVGHQEAVLLTPSGLPGAKGLPRGLGRSYGDVCLNPGGTLWLSAGLDRLIGFDAESGVLDVEPGVTLGDIQRVMIPQGWALPVTPGSQFVTVGGAIANDVHGKNHHARGSFCDHVTRLTLRRTDGTEVICGPDLLPDWFAATAGGLGLTGVILQARLQLMRVPGPWLDCETLPFLGLPEFFALSDGSEAGSEYTVSWIDGLSGRDVKGLFMRANPIALPWGGPLRAPARRGRSVPFTPPVSLINGLSLRAFNAVYHAMGRFRAGRGPVHYQPFFYPLDALRNWNRIYGPRGFYQYQCAVPNEGREEATAALLEEIRKAGQGSPLVVLKTFGAREAPGLLSFPRSGVTLAMDFPNRGARSLALMERLDAIVADAGGRVYPAKDARMSAEMFRRGYPALDRFMKYRDPGISSSLSRRLIGD
ncbi:MAG: FAD-binding oxidoreductase [Tabrizicola sp.]|jgi:FAD/FMN-containing dehydrogenase|nr:FAD-binding oxidoreductase [Tabrizicola sp.]